MTGGAAGDTVAPIRDAGPAMTTGPAVVEPTCERTRDAPHAAASAEVIVEHRERAEPVAARGWRCPGAGYGESFMHPVVAPA